MFSRILFATIAAATLLAAAPALATEGPSQHQPCSCCSDGSAHETDHRLREEALQKGSADRAAPAENDPYIRNQSFGG